MAFVRLRWHHFTLLRCYRLFNPHRKVTLVRYGMFDYVIMSHWRDFRTSSVRICLSPVAPFCIVLLLSLVRSPSHDPLWYPHRNTGAAPDCPGFATGAGRSVRRERNLGHVLMCEMSIVRAWLQFCRFFVGSCQVFTHI